MRNQILNRNDDETLNSDLVEALQDKATDGYRRLRVEILLSGLHECRKVFIREGLDATKRTRAYVDLAYPLEAVRQYCDEIGIDPDALAERFRNAMRSEKTAEIMFNNLGGWPAGTARNV